MSTQYGMEQNKRKSGLGRKLFRFLVVIGILAGSFLPGFQSEVSGASWSPELTRYPYLTDVVNSYATVNFATVRLVAPQNTAVVRYGKIGNCTANTVAATSRPFQVRSSDNLTDILEYQWKAVLRVEPNTQYCYRVYLGSAPEIDLLGSDPAPTFRTQLQAGNNDPFSFIVFGDWGYVRPDGTNPIQAALLSTIANSGTRFAVTVGDNVYPTEGFLSIPGQTQYGDLNVTGPSRSAVFGPNFWKEPGKSIPLFPAIGNHGFSQAANPDNHPHVLNFPQANAAALSGGRYTIDTYCCANGSTTGNYASVWYAIDTGITRIYVLEVAWGDSNVGTADAYKMSYDYFLAPGTPHWEWLKADLASHPAAFKMAVVHYPMYSDSTNEPSDTYMQGVDALEGLLAQNNVKISFSGHGHFYERNTAPNANSLITYIVGGGGANLTVIGNQCSSWDAFAFSWSTNSGGKACGAAPVPSSADQVHHVVKVTVNGGMVTVEPINAFGQVFDAQTYDFTAGQEGQAPSVPTGLVADVPGANQVQLSWGGSSDNTAVRGYTIYRNGVLWDTVTGGATTYLDDRATGGPYTYQVDAFDTWGNHSGLSNAAGTGTGTTVTIYLPLINR